MGTDRCNAPMDWHGDSFECERESGHDGDHENYSHYPPYTLANVR